MEQSNTEPRDRTRNHLLLPRTVIYSLWIAALACYAFAGTALVPLHGDEPEHLHSSEDFVTYFVEGNPGNLAVEPPYPPDSDSYIRIQTGTVTDYLFGLGWYLGGYGPDDLPETWTWWQDYEGNVALGSVPQPAILATGRVISTWLFAISIVALFGIARLIGGPALAFLASGLYAANPIILMNVRRAMTEGALFCFGLLTLFIALTIVKRQARGMPVHWHSWAALGVVMAMAVAAKFSGVVFAGVAIAWVIFSAMTHRWRNGLRRLAAMLALTAATGGIVFLLLMPALWRDLPGRVGDLIFFHKAVLDGIATGVPTGATTLADRIGRMVSVPFLTAPVSFEAPTWAEYDIITTQASLYQESWLRGIKPGALIGGILTGLMLAGLLILFLPSTIRVVSRDIAAGLALWYAAMAANSLMNPLAWSRYDMLMTPISIILTGVCIRQIAHVASRAARSSRLKRMSSPS